MFKKGNNMKYIQQLCLIWLSVIVCNVNAQTLDNAKNAYFHRDYQQVKAIITELKATQAENKVLMSELAMLTIAVDMRNSVDGADDDLEALLERHPNNANFHYMAGILWYHHAKNSSIFSKMSIYKKHVTANIKAAKLAPENERYQYVAASAYGQPSMIGGDSIKQKPIVDKLKVNNSAFAQMAMMDYQQNTQDKTNGFALIKQVSITFKDNIEVLERAAQLLWTFDEKEQAGALFSAACLLPPGEFEAYEKWSDACLLSASFAVDGALKKATGLVSIERLIKFTDVDDEESKYAFSLRNQLVP